MAVAGGECLQRLEAVDHDQPGAAFSDYAADSLGNTAEPAFIEGRPEVFVEDRGPDRGGVEKSQALAKPRDLLQRLRDGGEVDRGPLGPRVPDGVLLGQDRLAGARAPHDEADAIGGQPAAQDLIERCVPAQRVWPWLVQMGWDRGGWYSWDRLDNVGRPSATEVHPEWQDVAVGDQLSFWALGRRMDAYRVGVLEPGRFFGLYGYTDLRGHWLDPDKPRPAAYMEAIWGFLLNELPGRCTRLVVSGYQTFRPRWIERFAAESLLPVSWIMQARMLAVLKRNIGRAAPAEAHSNPVSRNGPAQSEDPSATP